MYYVCWGWGGGVGNRLGIYKKGGKGVWSTEKN